LDLLGWLNLDPPHSLGLFSTKLTDEPFDRLIRTTELNLNVAVQAQLAIARSACLNPVWLRCRLEFAADDCKPEWQVAGIRQWERVE
jgi:hypothetical protein